MSLEADKKFLFKSTLYNFLGSALKAISPALMIVAARIFGKEDFGIFISTQLLMQTLSNLAVFGLGNGLNWFLPQNIVNNRSPHLGFSESLSRSLIISIAIFVALLICAIFEWHKYFDSLVALSSVDLSIYALSIVPWAALIIFGGTVEGIRKPYYKMFITDCIVFTLTPIIGIAFYLVDIPHALPLGLLIANSLGCFIYIPLIKKTFPISLKFVRNKIPRNLLIYSIPYGVSNLTGLVLARVDLWLVLLLLGPGNAGIYAVMVTISNGLSAIRHSYNPILLPVIAGMSKDRLNTELKQVFSYCVNMVTFIQLAIGFFIVLFPDKILLLAGKDFVVQPETLGILLFTHLFSGFFLLSNSVLAGIGKSLYLLKMNIVSFCLAFLVNYFLIPVLGLPGAALSTLAFTLLQSVCNNIYIFKLRLKLFSKKIIPYAVWSVLLFLAYILLPYFSFELWQKIIFYVVALCGLAITKWIFK